MRVRVGQPMPALLFLSHANDCNQHVTAEMKGQFAILALRGGGLSSETAADLTISMLVLVGVALAARSGSSLVAAIFSTAPTGVPLSLWLVHRAASSSGSNLSIEAFLVAVVKGAIALAAFALGALALVKAAGDVPSLGALLGAGFASWALAWALLTRVSREPR